MFNHTDPSPFNSSFDPTAKTRSYAAAESMEADGFYDNHTRKECATEWHKRRAALK